jgi:hypothetical protein
VVVRGKEHSRRKALAAMLVRREGREKGREKEQGGEQESNKVGRYIRESWDRKKMNIIR